MTSGVRVFLLKSTNTKLVYQFEASTILEHRTVGHRFRLGKSFFASAKIAMRLIYRVIPSPIVSTDYSLSL